MPGAMGIGVSQYAPGSELPGLWGMAVFYPLPKRTMVSAATARIAADDRKDIA
jgi:hypothetical protein